MKKKILTYLFCALVVVTGAFFLTRPADASVCSQSWNARIVLRYGEICRTYDLSEHIDGFDKKQRSDRRIFHSVTGKAESIEFWQARGIDGYMSLCYVLPDFKHTVTQFCDKIEKLPVDATIKFFPDSDKKFVITPHQTGKKVNLKKLFDEIFYAFKEGANQVDLNLPVDDVAPNLTTQAAKKLTTKRGGFSTSCASSTADRQTNVALALSFFNGLTVENGQRVSFNQTVGERTEKRGFKTAKILVNGKYVDGVGGGVCQASTTIYNALLRAGVTVNAVCQHSVKSSYVAAGLDAMVNGGGADLVFTNETGNPLYFAAHCKNGKATVEIFGAETDVKIVPRSVVTKTVPYQTIKKTDTKGDFCDKIPYADQFLTLSNGVDGVSSETYLDFYVGGKLTKSVKIRQNTYKSIPKTEIYGAKSRPLPDLPQ